MMVILFLFIISTSNLFTFGYDSNPSLEACGRRYKSSRMLKPPCDLSVESFCTKAGTTYPWNAVRHFVRENQGLMKRMYGDQLQRSVIEAEMLSNDIETFRDEFFDATDEHLYFKNRYSKSLDVDNDLDLIDDVKNDDNDHNDEYKDEDKDDDKDSGRLLREEDVKNADVMNTKFVFPEMSVKYGDLMNNKSNNKSKQESLDKNSEKISNVSNLNEDKRQSTTENVNLKRYGNIEGTNLTVTDSYNSTYYFYEVEDVQNSTENVTERTTTTVTTDTSTESTLNYEETTTIEPERKKSSTSTMLFQDANHKRVTNFKGQGINACPVKQEVVAPYWANNTRGQLLALINIYPFEQYIHCETCTFQHKQMYCRDGCRCEQQYRIHRLLAYDPNNECRGIFADWFKFPSCCICKCYFFTEGGRVTARSPRSKNEEYVPNWFKKKSKEYYND